MFGSEKNSFTPHITMLDITILKFLMSRICEFSGACVHLVGLVRHFISGASGHVLTCTGRGLKGNGQVCRGFHQDSSGAELDLNTVIALIF